ncbi:MAG: helix-turn-helix domain-containing protein [Verrucomicrobia bacterium]|nr:helix-turn-helix domain-containing protein [Verrucomicrobiota bacterium]
MPDSLDFFLAELKKLTGLEVCLYDLTYFTKDAPELRVSRERRTHCSPYCELVKSSKAAWQKCVQTEHWRAAQAARRKGAFLHTCHAGVTELILPIQAGNRLLGALYLGQAFTLSPGQIARVAGKLARQFGLPAARLTALAATQPQVTASRLRGFEPMLRLLKVFIEHTEELLSLREHVTACDPAAKAAKDVATADIASVPLFFLAQIRPPSAQIRRAVEWVSQSYWKNPKQSGAAREAGLSLSQFSRRFRVETGMTFRAFLTRTRIEAAAFLLKRTGLNVSEVAARVGYENTTSLQRAFKRGKGCPPRVYLRRQAL